MAGSGNTTVPTRADDPSRSAPYQRLVPALFIMWSAHQPERIGEVALFDPSDGIHFIIGREIEGGPARVHFFQIRPGETIDGGPLTGENISQEQFRITVDGNSLRLQNTGSCTVRVDGTEVERNVTVLVGPGSVVEVHGHCVLLVGESPLSLPRPNHRLLPLQPFGEADRMRLVGESRRMWELREDTLFASTAGRDVFVDGETGTGKELVAAAIHFQSPRAAGPYITTNASSFTQELVASELFGNPKGYPNPGTPERVGYFGQARREGNYNRVGDPVSRPTECVVILATNGGRESVKHDLLHRLGVTVKTPSLAERLEDVPLLAQALLRRRAEFEGRRVPVDQALIANILRTRMPGNIRELDNILTESIKASGGELALRWPPRLTMPPPAPLSVYVEPDEPSVGELLAGLGGAPPDPSRARMREALDMHDGNVGKTATYLKVSVRHLYRLREKYGLLDPEDRDRPE